MQLGYGLGVSCFFSWLAKVSY